MQLYRIGPEAWLSVLNGLGGSYESGGRWNRPGTPVVYFGTTPSVAMLEMSNYLPSPRLVPAHFRLGTFNVPEEAVETWPIETLPDDWADYPYPASTQVMGTTWLQARTALVLLVPSSAVAGGLENMAVINPLHPQVGQIELVDITASIFNPRAFRGL